MSNLFRTQQHMNREIYVANYFFCMYPDRFKSAIVDAEDFFSIPIIGAWWEEAKRLDDAGKKWEFQDLVHPEQVGEVMKVMQAIINAEYAHHLIDHLQARVREATSHRHVYAEMQEGLKCISDGGDSDDLILHLSRSMDLLRRSNNQGWMRLSDAVKSVVERYLKSVEEGVPITAVMPLKGLQKHLNGFPYSKLVWILATTSGHKTTLARLCATHYAKQGGFSAYISLEDSPEDLAARYVASESSGVTVNQLMTGQKGEDTLKGIYSVTDRVIKEDPNMIILHEMMTLSKLIARLHEVAKKGARMVCVDFFQLIDRDEDERRSESDFWKYAANKLRDAADELNIALVVCVQPTKEGTQKALRGEALEGPDIRGGSAIEQAAFGLLVLHRVFEKDGKITPDVIDIVIQKWKHGDKSALRFGLDAAHDRIYDIAPSNQGTLYGG